MIVGNSDLFLLTNWIGRLFVRENLFNVKVREHVRCNGGQQHCQSNGDLIPHISGKAKQQPILTSMSNHLQIYWIWYLFDIELWQFKLEKKFAFPSFNPSGLSWAVGRRDFLKLSLNYHQVIEYFYYWTFLMTFSRDLFQVHQSIKSKHSMWQNVMWTHCGNWLHRVNKLNPHM